MLSESDALLPLPLAGEGRGGGTPQTPVDERAPSLTLPPQAGEGARLSLLR
jgi:hypothetical protein